MDFLVPAFVLSVKKKELIILKPDFEKAFDKVEHQVILYMLLHKGFTNRWRGWIAQILSSAVLLNGNPRKFFHCKRGVRQGDPLSPLLFVLATDLLKSIINSTATRGLLSYQLDVDFGGDFPIVQ